ncbi:hypothetical protein [Plantactinospora sp. BB1]|uniref:hypothetical protein n=1 Tax=Plantactinospora sp. BB1 TaxID=2071627 RepID=UPI00131F1132|nr:hypothetical protein [Plantactinospora sp. BB1]
MPELMSTRAAQPGYRSDPSTGRSARPSTSGPTDLSAGVGPELADRIAEEVATVRWLAPEEIRTRARRRSRIRSLVGTVAVLVVVASGSVMAVERYVPRPLPAGGQPLLAGPSAPVPSPDPVAIPASALLQPEDVGPGLVVEREEVRLETVVEVVDATVPLGCPGYALRDRYDGLARVVRRHTVQQPPTVPGDPHSGAPVVHERVFRLLPGAARQVFADARAVPDLCAEYRTPGAIEVDGRGLAVDAEHRWRVLAEDFAGDESVLLDWRTTVRRQDSAAVVDGPASRLVGVVRVGDLVATVDRVDEAPDPKRAEALTRRAAVRLCEAANPPC